MAVVKPDLRFDLTVARLTPRTHVATVTGELDLHTEPHLRRWLSPLADRDGATLIVDLSGAPFVDSTALGTLTALARRLREGGGELVIASDDPRLRRLLELTGLLAFMSFESSLAGAVERAAPDTTRSRPQEGAA
jgi:anti-sigma B factor antagonist